MSLPADDRAGLLEADAAAVRALLAALDRRKSVRGFLPAPVDQAELTTLFGAAQRAPSWCNVQPWRVWLTAPAVTAEVTAALVEAATSTLPAPDLPFPPTYPEPYLARRRACGFALYGAMGIARDDKERRHEAWLRNYHAFGAPHLAIVARDRTLGEYATLDVGVWLGVLVTTAALMGIDLCAMASAATHPAVLRERLGIPPELDILFGIAIGREDPAVPANACRTTRDPLEQNLSWVGF
jgi:nitroreductase